MAEKKDKTAQGLVLGGMGGTILGAIAALLMTKPAKAAPPDEKLDYLMECQTAIVQLLEQLTEGNSTMIQLLQQLVTLQGGVAPGEGIQVTVRTPWVAEEPEEIFSQAILAADTFYSDKMVDWRQGKRIYFFVESTLNQDAEIQVIGNKTESKEGATDIGPAKICPANDNISLGPDWDQWCPYIGIKITVTAAPTAGLLTITAVRQE